MMTAAQKTCVDYSKILLEHLQAVAKEENVALRILKKAFLSKLTIQEGLAAVEDAISYNRGDFSNLQPTVEKYYSLVGVTLTTKANAQKEDKVVNALLNLKIDGAFLTADLYLESSPNLSKLERLDYILE